MVFGGVNMIDFVEAVKRPWKTDAVTIILGILFTVFAPLRPLLHGLGVESSRRTQANNSTMPHFSDFIDMYLSGLIVLVVSIIYFIPALLVLVAGTVTSVPYLVSIFQNLAQNPVLAIQSFTALLVNGALFGAVALFLAFLGAVMVPVGVQLYAHDKKIGSAFQFSKVWVVVSTAHYWVSWLLMMAYGVVLVGLVAIFSIPEFNTLSALFFGAAGYTWWMTWYILFGETVKESGVLSGHVHHPHTVHGTRSKGIQKKKRKGK